MCGIVGIFLKNKELHSQLGSLFSPMLTEICLLYTSPSPRD